MIPMFKPAPPRLSEAQAALQAIEASGIYSNYGPVNTQFEQALIDRVFGGVGACLTVCNATLGLMLAVRQCTAGRSSRQRYALMPSFTFAAAAQAALWCGLTPLLCDIDPETWAADPKVEAALLEQYEGEIAVIMPYATFGYDINLRHYEQLTERFGIPVVVDAAASLGTVSGNGTGFGAGFRGASVFSMHATKSFATGEAGVIYSADAALIAELRVMCNFGFGKPRTATVSGLNAKLSEVGALLALLKLDSYPDIIKCRGELVDLYRQHLPQLTFQPYSPTHQAHQFCPALLPKSLASSRLKIQAAMKENGSMMLHYFSPHLAEQEYFQQSCVTTDLSVTDDIASRIISLPLYDSMVADEVLTVVQCLTDAIAEVEAGADRSLVGEQLAHA